MQRKSEKRKKRGKLHIILSLLWMIRPFIGTMLIAVFMGTMGHFAAISLTVLGSMGIAELIGTDTGVSLQLLIVGMAVASVLRGILRYAEQACNHDIAFKLLAYIRAKVFRALRSLAPAKLDGSRSGDLIALITSDVELLEVFFAHTISPVLIAILVSFGMVGWIGHFHPAAGMYAGVCYLLVGGVIPFVNGRIGGKKGRMYREQFSDLNAAVLDNLFGLQEIVQYGCQRKRREDMNKRTESLEKVNWSLKRGEMIQKNVTEVVLAASGVGMCILTAVLVQSGEMHFVQAMQTVAAMMCSFGPVVAISSLSNQLKQTLASGERILELLEERPLVEELTEGAEVGAGNIACEAVRFGYDGEEKPVLSGFTHHFEAGKIHGILGKSGCGKSTLLKLMMRFYETEQGEILMDGSNVNHVRTDALRQQVAYMTQETFLFHDTIENNIRIAKVDATHEEVVEAAKRAAVHEFIMSLPKGYETVIDELGDSVSGGEKQRIGLARVFLYNSKVILLDEPTSNIDSMNEGIILKSLLEERNRKTVILVSHRKSTMGIVEEQLAM